MNISVQGKRKADLIKCINDKLASDTQLAQQPEFIKFSMYRAKSAGRPPKNIRNSSNKASEDAIEMKVDLPATGYVSAFFFATKLISCKELI